jgi:BCD family chlorophyll transporter-like MFS transporter
MATGGGVRDLVVAMGDAGAFLGREFAGAATGYVVVYIIELILLMATLVCMAPLVKKRNARESTQ